MIKSIEIQNFKAIKQKYFPMRNLNVLLGLNGMGKSSFIQAILCLRQSDRLYKGIMEINSNYVNLGTSKDVLYQYSQEEQIGLHLKFLNKKSLDLRFKYEIEANYFDYLMQEGYEYPGRDIIEQIMEEQPLFNANFQYLQTHRIEPKPDYPKSHSHVVRDKNLGNRGEYTAHFIEAFHNREINFENLLHKKSWVQDDASKQVIVNKTLINQVNLWLGEISPNVNVRTTSISSSNVLLEYEFKQPNFGRTNRYKPENVGFGITYCLPVVVALLSARAGELLIIENPESHLHPRGQAELGRLIALTAMNDVQIVIETHSDHILNGIRVAVKEQELAQDKAVIFYFEKEIEKSEQYAQVTNIEIDERGELSEYPKHLLNEWSYQLLKLLK